MALLACWLLLIWAPQHRAQRNLAAQIVQAESRVAEYQHTLEELQQFVGERESLRKMRRELNSKLYGKEDVLTLFAQFRNQAQQHHLVLKEITPPVEELINLNRLAPDSTQPFFLTVGLRLEGDYADFGRFVRTIEEAVYFRGLERCQIHGTPEGGTTSFQITFRTMLGTVGEES